MLDKDTLIKIKNRDNGKVGYVIPDLGNLHRSFNPGEIKELPFEEIQKLSWTDGGKEILDNYLVIENDEAIAELLGTVEPEYNYTEKEIIEILTTGSLDQLKDTLDFGPKGVIELIKDLSIKLPLNDVAKRQAILEKTGFNVTNAIANNEESEKEEIETPTRRANPVNAATASNGRRTEPIKSKYNIVSKK